MINAGNNACGRRRKESSLQTAVASQVVQISSKRHLQSRLRGQVLTNRYQMGVMRVVGTQDMDQSRIRQA